MRLAAVLISRMAEKGIWYTPTISTYGIMNREPFVGVLTEDQMRKSAQVAGKGLEAMKVSRTYIVHYHLCRFRDLAL